MLNGSGAKCLHLKLGCMGSRLTGSWFDFYLLAVHLSTLWKIEYLKHIFIFIFAEWHTFPQLPTFKNEIKNPGSHFIILTFSLDSV